MSDIGAFTFRPYFVAGCSIASASFLISLHRIHSTWYSRARRSWLAGACSAMAILFGLIGAVSWVLQAIYDGFHYHGIHIMLVYGFCVGVFISAAFTSFTHHQVARLEIGGDKPQARRPSSR